MVRQAPRVRYMCSEWGGGGQGWPEGRRGREVTTENGGGLLGVMLVGGRVEDGRMWETAGDSQGLHE